VRIASNAVLIMASLPHFDGFRGSTPTLLQRIC
jgi:hypothetical protein